MRLRSALLLSLLSSACTPAASQDTSLSFGAFKSSPVVLTQFGIEGPMGPIGQPQLVAGDADGSLPRTGGGIQIGWPGNGGADGMWRLEAQWVELPTGRAYRAALDVPVDGIETQYSIKILDIIFGPHGLFIAASDKLSDDYKITPNSLAGTCGTRMPAADEDLRRRTDTFTEMDFIMDKTPPFPARTDCPDPGR